MSLVFLPRRLTLKKRPAQRFLSFNTFRREWRLTLKAGASALLLSGQRFAAKHFTSSSPGLGGGATDQPASRRHRRRAPPSQWTQGGGRDQRHKRASAKMINHFARIVMVDGPVSAAGALASPRTESGKRHTAPLRDPILCAKSSQNAERIAAHSPSGKSSMHSKVISN